MVRYISGIEYLKDVVINDKLGIADQLEAQMQHVVDTYQDEWATVVNVSVAHGPLLRLAQATVSCL